MMVAKWNTDGDEQVFVPYVDSPRQLEKPRVTSFFQRMFQRLSRLIIEDVPPEIDACETCRETECTEERFETCENRIKVYQIRMNGRS